jgi:ribosomal protein L11
MQDLNAYDIDAAKKIIIGTAKNMGLEIVSG